MCGIAGILDRAAGSSATALSDVLQGMTDAIAHRGPDDEGHWVDVESGIALGHRRLSILDLSPLGHQPMTSACGRYVVVFNGEIYNFKSLRQSLEAEGATGWRGHSDTEVLLQCFSRWGIQDALPHLNGMFAIAVWDLRERQLTLIRDRMGEKPLYYGWANRRLLFASQLSAFYAEPEFRQTISPDAVVLLLRHNYIPAPYTIYQNVFKLPPGTSLTIGLDASPNSLAEPCPYWSALDAYQAGHDRPFRGSAEDAVDALDELMLDAVKIRMESDVPLGAFLSGGIDSSTVVSLMQSQSSQPIRTFSIGFRESGFDEAAEAKAVAEHLGCDHTELYVTAADALELVPKLAEVYDEPFADTSQIPTTLLAQLTRRYVTVSLSGDGGDEIFWGYTRYQRTMRDWNRLSTIPGLVRTPVAQLLRRLPLGATANRLAELAEFHTAMEFYRRKISHWTIGEEPVRNAAQPETPFDTFAGKRLSIGAMSLMDTLTYLPDDILTKVDRATMWVALEGRIPLLDHRVAEFAFSLPDTYKIRDNKTKWVLRQVLRRRVPAALIERPKKGFGVPVGAWLRGPLREWAESLLAPRVLRDGGWFDEKNIAQAWQQHLAGQNNTHRLWTVLMFQAWLASCKVRPQREHRQVMPVVP